MEATINNMKFYNKKVQVMNQKKASFRFLVVIAPLSRNGFGARTHTHTQSAQRSPKRTAISVNNKQINSNRIIRETKGLLTNEYERKMEL